MHLILFLYDLIENHKDPYTLLDKFTSSLKILVSYFPKKYHPNIYFFSQKY